VADRKALRVALDWTEFDRDGQITSALLLADETRLRDSAALEDGQKTELKERQGGYEDAIVERLHDLIEPDVRVTLLADRGFGAQARYEHLDRLGFSFVIRFREKAGETPDAEMRALTITDGDDYSTEQGSNVDGQQ
jgi:hypothetical protein